MRHGESQNNALRSESQELYQQERTCDPELSEKGVNDTISFGKMLRD
jgi:broad specificity phosphatase PhoE